MSCAAVARAASAPDAGSTAAQPPLSAANTTPDSLPRLAPPPGGPTAGVPPPGDAAATKPAAAAADTAHGAGTAQPEAFPLPARARPPWVAAADMHAGDLEAHRPATLADVLEDLPHAVVRIAGDRGAPAFLSLSPVDLPAPEILLDGVPSRSPADLDPALWDRSAAGLGDVRGEQPARATPAPVPGAPSAVRLLSDPGAIGQTVVRTHFAKQQGQTYLRSLALTTPDAPKSLRLEYEEWKAEDGIDFLLFPGAATDVLGRAKMRRFRAGFDLRGAQWRAGVLFGRGRRFDTATARSNGTTERWTGDVALALDVLRGDAFWQARGYHLDWHDQDFVHGEIRDASRQGLQLTRSTAGDGLCLSVGIERQTARFTAADSALRVVSDPAYVGHAGAGVTRHVSSCWQAQLSGDVLYAEQASDRFGGEGGATLTYAPARRLTLQTTLRRALRTPTLLETDGFVSFDLPSAVPFTVTRGGAGRTLPLERQDAWAARAGLRLGRLRTQAGLERHWLGDGIGWQPDPGTDTERTAHTVGGLTLRIDQVVGDAELNLGTARHGLAGRVWGHRVLGGLHHALDRGAGWPREAVTVQLRWWHVLLGPHDRFSVIYEFRHLGPRYDDRLAPYDILAPDVTRHDLRFALQLRDAELYLALWNLTDAVQQEVAGTRGRSRELVWGLAWPFFN
jgi:hypothetical protein